MLPTTLLTWVFSLDPYNLRYFFAMLEETGECHKTCEKNMHSLGYCYYVLVAFLLLNIVSNVSPSFCNVGSCNRYSCKISMFNCFWYMNKNYSTFHIFQIYSENDIFTFSSSKLTIFTKFTHHCPL